MYTPCMFQWNKSSLNSRRFLIQQVDEITKICIVYATCGRISLSWHDDLAAGGAGRGGAVLMGEEPQTCLRRYFTLSASPLVVNT